MRVFKLSGNREIELTDSLIARFRSYLRRDESTGCLLFTGTTRYGGYGNFGIGGRKGGMVGAHRLAWVIAGNEIPEDKPNVLHNCPSGDNPACCEPAHL